MNSLQTSYEFTLPRGYVDSAGQVHRTGTMRLATARDELEPLRDPRVEGPDDPRLTILVLTRVVERLGDLPMVTPHEIEGLFAVDLAFLQDFYGVINFGSQEEYDALVSAQTSSALLGVASPSDPDPSAAAEPESDAAAEPADAGPDREPEPRPTLRRAVEEIPRKAN
ncbi:hypothetical protein [Nocardioides sp. YIM 152315]|uniref:hypothetical protein n=1 Tax=Nocardioides sp. YIM 152315 TaxID=3031760 RepID=UPI0023DB14E4|nr:hypothetical protein [Nocardioides sp. YIM 152315]MDF1603305.1 hypothetical protein [Nocardioides sp. YIM 152315]